MTDDARPEDRNARVTSNICTRCRKPIHMGHRVLLVNISHGPGTDPKEIGSRGLMLSGEYEFCHVDCHDPLLRKPVVAP